MYEAYSIVGTLDNNIIIKCIAEEEIYLSVNTNNHKVNRINLYLNN